MHRVLMTGAVGVLGLVLVATGTPSGGTGFRRDCPSPSAYRVCLAQGADVLRDELVEGTAEVSRSLEIPGHDLAIHSGLASKLRGGGRGLGTSGPLE